VSGKVSILLIGLPTALMSDYLGVLKRWQGTRGRVPRTVSRNQSRMARSCLQSNGIRGRCNVQPEQKRKREFLGLRHKKARILFPTEWQSQRFGLVARDRPNRRQRLLNKYSSAP
jgi:hypothetical protein